MVDSMELRAGNAPRWGVSSIRRFIDKDVIVAGTYQAVFIVEWTGSHFCLLNYVEDLHNCRSVNLIIGLINSIDIADNSVFTVSGKDTTINKIDFSR